ncbi:hypothetical protein MKW94_006447 [Papaver nudicaule]|uniref:Uncharacterized protein n=1 Tax=Papaver nudicaule TaxID=74823 RepID=A0AA41SA36_PAPNU|nr:hypothetical protein [Papaver nudicaule]
MASSNFMKRWVRPEVYPLLLPMVTVVGLVSMQLIRNITTNPEVRYILNLLFVLFFATNIEDGYIK